MESMMATRKKRWETRKKIKSKNNKVCSKETFL
jgi:hypothetical protein